MKMNGDIRTKRRMAKLQSRDSTAMKARNSTAGAAGFKQQGREKNAVSNRSLRQARARKAGVLAEICNLSP
ncbi:hypothetical protein CEXT_463791 [Caerostris extrusa]|uniref:Uncharacterized protein n=1 Tax=Caerostris extrusa TaxID=172846 RepID=A0AAV4Q0Q6_CAEEX|nr:hypothetical protein CEXT_463791 [Caerostris extrusa]